MSVVSAFCQRHDTPRPVGVSSSSGSAASANRLSTSSCVTSAQAIGAVAVSTVGVVVKITFGNRLLDLVERLVVVVVPARPERCDGEQRAPERDGAASRHAFGSYSAAVLRKRSRRSARSARRGLDPLRDRDRRRGPSAPTRGVGHRRLEARRDAGEERRAERAAFGHRAHVHRAVRCSRRAPRPSRRLGFRRRWRRCGARPTGDASIMRRVDEPRGFERGAANRGRAPCVRSRSTSWRAAVGIVERHPLAARVRHPDRHVGADRPAALRRPSPPSSRSPS